LSRSFFRHIAGCLLATQRCPFGKEEETLGAKKVTKAAFNKNGGGRENHFRGGFGEG
jgi:hypothetical protein